MDKSKTLICVALIFGTTAIIALGDPVSFYPFHSFALYAIGFIALYIFVFKLKTNNNLAKSLLFIVITGIVLRTLFLSSPLSDDVNRYAWEGMIQAQGVNPYITAPAELSDEFSNDPIFAGINHKDVSTAYPPVAMLTFRAISAISYSLTGYKIFFIICDSLVLIVLALLIKQWQLPANRLALYAWNPLILLYGAGEGHFDVLHILFIVIALLFFIISSKKHAKASDNNKFRFPTANECLITYCNDIGIFSGLAFLMLGAAVMTKFLSIIILPFMITRRNLKWLPCFFIPFLTIIPFWSPDMSSGLMKFSGEMSYNDVIPKLLRYFLTGTAYQLTMVGTFAIGMGLIWLMTQQNRLTGISYAFLWCICCLPCVHIWYLMPLALFITAVPNRAVFLLFITCGTGFWVLNHQLVTGEWREFLWIWLATYVPVVLLLFYDWNNIRLPWLKTSPTPSTVDIIIPVYNEAERITEHLASVEQAIQGASATKIQFTITLVDAGSTDDTINIAEDFLQEMLEHRTSNWKNDPVNNKSNSAWYQIINAAEKGRGNQLATGVANTTGDMVIMLHADSIMHEDALLNLVNKVIQNPTAGWGILGHNYDKKSLRMHKVRFMNRFRFKVMGIAFGDQGIWVRRDIMAARDGIPAIPLMEDIEISLRLAGVPRLSLGESLTLSTRRWDNRTLFTYSLQVIYFVAWYMLARRLGFNIKSISAKLYAQYY
ncbi:MAG: glycosyltransferase [Victivallaceae bacterium]|nr:glycosyltransferase [Victivallaceae bacterium]